MAHRALFTAGLAALIVLAAAAHGQAERTSYHYLWLRIDTLIGADRIPEKERGFFLELVGTPFEGDGENASSYCQDWAHEQRPYTVRLLLRETTDEITLRVSNKSPHPGVTLTGLRAFRNDTVTLSRWEILDDRLPRKTTSNAFYYRQRNDSVDSGNPYKVRRFSRTEGDSMAGPRDLYTRINGIPDTIRLDTTTVTTLSTGHGRGPSRRYRRYAALRNRKGDAPRRTFKLYYLVVHARTKEKQYKGVVRLKQ